MTLLYDKAGLARDPKLVAASHEIASILDRYECAAAIVLASDTHSEFVVHFPKGSPIQFTEGNFQANYSAMVPKNQQKRATNMLLALADGIRVHAEGLAGITQNLLVRLADAGYLQLTRPKSTKRKKGAKKTKAPEETKP